MKLIFNIGLMFAIKAWAVYMKEEPQTGSVSKYLDLLIIIQDCTPSDVDPRVFDAAYHYKLEIKKL